MSNRFLSLVLWNVDGCVGVAVGLSRSFLSLMYNNFQRTQTDTFISTHSPPSLVPFLSIPYVVRLQIATEQNNPDNHN